MMELRRRLVEIPNLCRNETAAAIKSGGAIMPERTGFARDGQPRMMRVVQKAIVGTET
jgi:hypothetical protein